MSFENVTDTFMTIKILNMDVGNTFQIQNTILQSRLERCDAMTHPT